MSITNLWKSSSAKPIGMTTDLNNAIAEADEVVNELEWECDDDYDMGYHAADEWL